MARDLALAAQSAAQPGRAPGACAGRPGGRADGGAAGANAGFSGDCGFCHKPGHKKSDCKELDEVMAKRRAAGLSPARSFGGKGNGGKNGHKGGFGGSGQGGGGAFGLDFAFLTWVGLSI